MRVARNDSEAGAGRGKASAENWRVKEFKRREETNEIYVYKTKIE